MSNFSGVRGIGFLPLFLLEFEAAEEDPPLSIPEVKSSLTMSTDSLPYCLRGAYLFWCFVGYRLSDIVPPRALIGTVGGADVPKRKCVGPLGSVCLVSVALCPASPCNVSAARAYAPLPLCVGSVCHVLCSSPPVAALSASVSISSSRALWKGLPTSSSCPICRAWAETHWFLAF